jgi:hypothetical protein
VSALDEVQRSQVKFGASSFLLYSRLGVEKLKRRAQAGRQRAELRACSHCHLSKHCNPVVWVSFSTTATTSVHGLVCEHAAVYSGGMASMRILSL